MRFDETGLVWVSPSPNIRNLKQAILYPAIGLLERTNLSVGRGTDAPFEHFGAPWLEPASFCHTLNQNRLPGLRFVPHFFTPDSGPYAGERCGGAWLMLTDAGSFEPIRTAYLLFRTLCKTYPRSYDPTHFDTLLANEKTLAALQSDTPLEVILDEERRLLAPFRKIRARYLLYH